MEGFYRKKGGARMILTKENNRLFLGLDIFLAGEGNRKVFILQPLLSVVGGRGSDAKTGREQYCRANGESFQRLSVEEKDGTQKRLEQGW